MLITDQPLFTMDQHITLHKPTTTLNNTVEPIAQKMACTIPKLKPAQAAGKE
jgi:hypothetical protein